jgi:hypothetical protein
MGRHFLVNVMAPNSRAFALLLVLKIWEASNGLAQKDSY